MELPNAAAVFRRELPELPRRGKVFHDRELRRSPPATRPVLRRQKRRVLRSAAIYGANGHGKTNLVHALIFIRDLILEGSEVDKPLKVRKFKTSAGRINRLRLSYSISIRVGSSMSME